MIFLSNYCKLIFIPLMFINVFLLMSSNSWMMLWICFEINLMSFIPLLNNNTKFSSEMSFNYFISQSFGSIIFFLASMQLSLNSLIYTSILFYSILNMKMFWLMLISLSMILKLGLFPFHYWYPKVIKNISWMNMFILSTWLKISPLMIMLFFPLINKIWFISIFFSMIISLMGLNQTSLRLIMCFSSMNHLSWMTMNIILNKFSWLIYFIIYTLIMLSSIIPFNLFNLNTLTDLFKMMYSYKNMKSLILLNFFSLSGLPPFLGFYPKLISIKMLLLNSFYFMSIFMMMCSLISIFFYLQIISSNLFLLSNESKINMFKYKFLKNNFLYLFIPLFLSLSQLISLM
uniref:NADH dehydrogenase subunit 2 n=1 Tax=Sirex nitobei TaxID=1602346 RepID=UPI0023D8BF04|nr:NADH dehydrogenase subunit 2 [Sirex nitobei]WDR47208.1 NADH dehydrogenase subunit 2 [Sirex nitobei]